MMDSSMLPSAFAPSQCVSNSHSPQSLYFQRYSKKKSTIAMVEEDKKKKRESVLDPKGNTSYFPGMAALPEEDALNNLSKSIVFPKHTLKRITEEACDLNATLHLIHENCYEDPKKMLDNTSVVDFMADDSQILMMDSSVYLPKVLPSLSPRINKHKESSGVAETGSEKVPKRSTQLFEDFLVIGADLTEIQGEVKGGEVLKPAILWQYGKCTDEYRFFLFFWGCEKKS